MNNDVRNKRQLVGKNIFECMKPPLKTALRLSRSVKNVYTDNYYINATNELCSVLVRQTHPLNMIKDFILNGFNPIILRR